MNSFTPAFLRREGGWPFEIGYGYTLSVSSTQARWVISVRAHRRR